MVQNYQNRFLCLYTYHPQYLEPRYSKRKQEKKNNLLSVGVLKGFLMLSIIHALLWHFYKSHSKMFQCYVSLKHRGVHFLYESQIDANNLVTEKD